MNDPWAAAASLPVGSRAVPITPHVSGVVHEDSWGEWKKSESAQAAVESKVSFADAGTQSEEDVPMVLHVVPYCRLPEWSPELFCTFPPPFYEEEWVSMQHFRELEHLVKCNRCEMQALASSLPQAIAAITKALAPTG